MTDRVVVRLECYAQYHNHYPKSYIDGIVNGCVDNISSESCPKELLLPENVVERITPEDQKVLLQVQEAIFAEVKTSFQDHCLNTKDSTVPSLFVERFHGTSLILRNFYE